MHEQIVALLLKIAPEELEICKRELQSDRQCVKNEHYCAAGEPDRSSKVFRPNTSFGSAVQTEASSFLRGMNVISDVALQRATRCHVNTQPQHHTMRSMHRPRKVNGELPRLQILSVPVVMQAGPSVSLFGFSLITFTQSFDIKCPGRP